MATPKQWKRRSRWSLIIGTILAALTVGAVMAYADTQFPDGDAAVPPPNLSFATQPGTNQRGCDQLGTDVAGQINVKYTGNAQSPHYTAGHAFYVVFDIPAGSGITASASPTNVPNDWGTTTEVAIPFTTNVPVGTLDNTYQVGVTVYDTDTNGYSANGKQQYNVQVACGNVAPTGPTANPGGPYDGNEGAAISLDGSGSTGNNLTYKWTFNANGNMDAGGACNFSSDTAVSPTITCTDDSNSGTFSVCLTVTDSVTTLSDGPTCADLTVHNVKPTVTFASGPTSVDENGTTKRSYTYTISDPGTNDTVTADSVVPNCDSTNQVEGDAASNATNNSTSGSFDCLFPDGEKPATTAVLSVTATDDDGATSDAATRNVTVNNVAPTVNAFTPTVNFCQVSVSSIVATDPGQAYDNNYTGSIAWGDLSTNTSLPATAYGASNVTFTGPFNHTYSVGGAYTVTASVTDEDTDTGTNTASVNNTFGIVGWPVPPIMPGKVFNTGSTIPVKITTTGCAGGVTARISVSGSVTVKPAGKANVADLLRWTSSLPGYIYNLQTKTWPVGFYDVTITFSGAFTGTYTTTIQLVK